MRRLPSRSARLWLLTLAVVFTFVHTSALGANQQKKVLVLYSTRRDAQIVLVGERELPRILDAGLAEGLDYYSEYIDRARFPDPVYQVALRDFFRQKYRDSRLDVVIAINDLALTFVAAHRDTLFPDVPIVYFSSNRATHRPPNSTGAVMETNFSGSLELAARLQPDARRVFVVSGDAGDDGAFTSAARAQFRPFESRFTFEYLIGLPTPQLQARLASLPVNSIVYYLVVDRDGGGHIFHPLEYLDLVTTVATAPVYSWVDSAMDHGIVGGSLKDQKAQVDAVAGLALKVLGGQRADDVPVITPDLNVKQVDWRQLQRWGISEARVPTGTIVKFKDLSVWDRYGNYVALTLAILLAQTALIAGLLIQRRYRRQAEELVRGKQAELRTSYERIRDISARLLDAQESERSHIARELHDDIGQQVALLSIDLELMGGVLAGDALARAQYLARSVHDLSHRLHPARLRLIGLVGALRGLQEELTRSDVAITFTHHGVPSTLAPDLTLCLYRVVQEALQNALKYSSARQISVTLTGDPEGLVLTITDDGVGFDVNAAWGSGLGLVSMSERLEAFGGTLHIRSTPGGGTRLRATVPLMAAAADGEIVAV